MTLDLGQFSDAVNVVAAPVPVAVSPKFTEPLRDTPQSIDVMPRQVMADQGVTTLRDAVRNVAGISIAAGEGGAQGDNLTIRGFTARNDIFIDGMRDFGSYYRDPFNQEEVQVLQGTLVGHVRPRHDRRRPQSGDQDARARAVHRAAPQPRHRRDARASRSTSTSRCRRSATAPLPPERDGDDAHVAGRDVAENRRYRHRAVARARARHADARDLQLLSPGRERHAGLRHSVAVQRAGAGDAQQLLRLREQQLPRHATPTSAGARSSTTSRHNVTLTDQVRYANYGRDAQITEAQGAGDA